MAEDPGAHVSGSLPAVEEARVVSAEHRTAKRKRYYAERDATKVYLFEQYERWQNLMGGLSLKSDKDLVSTLLDYYLSNKDRHFRYYELYYEE